MLRCQCLELRRPLFPLLHPLETFQTHREVDAGKLIDQSGDIQRPRKVSRVRDYCCPQVNGKSLSHFQLQRLVRVHGLTSMSDWPPCFGDGVLRL